MRQQEQAMMNRSARRTKHLTGRVHCTLACIIASASAAAITSHQWTGAEQVRRIVHQPTLALLLLLYANPLISYLFMQLATWLIKSNYSSTVSKKECIEKGLFGPFAMA